MVGSIDVCCAVAAAELHRGASLTHTALPKQGRVQLRCLCPLAQEALRFDDFKARREQAARCLQVIAGPVPLLAAGRAGAGACSAKRTGRVARGVYCESFN